jgi:murein DD-endopeptidase MepM/ murein hydrolase activator NlpD
MTEQDPGPGTEPEGYIGPEEHGPEPPEEAPVPRRTITSAVWGGVPARVTSEHAQDVTQWNPTCSWYQYGKDLCLNGCQHPGMDIGIVRGTALFAAEGGSVGFAGWANVFRPHFIEIRTDSGSLHIYAHMWHVDPAVVKGARVEAGQYLGDSGEQTKKGTMTPDGSGAHLHFEVRSGGCAVNPEPVLVGAPSGGQAQAATDGTSFKRGNRIRVSKGPLNLRSSGSTQAAIVERLPTETALIVIGGPTKSEGHTWYQVQVIEAPGQGWVAGEFCERIE